MQNVLGTILILRQQKDWLGGFKNLLFLLTFFTFINYANIVGGLVRKSRKCDDVIYGWSPLERSMATCGRA